MYKDKHSRQAIQQISSPLVAFPGSGVDKDAPIVEAQNALCPDLSSGIDRVLEALTAYPK